MERRVSVGVAGRAAGLFLAAVILLSGCGPSIIEATYCANNAPPAPLGCTESANRYVAFAFGATRLAGVQTTDGTEPQAAPVVFDKPRADALAIMSL